MLLTRQFRRFVSTPSRSLSHVAEFAQHGRVATILLNRPKALNSYNHEMVERIIARLGEIEKDESLDIVLMEGAGGKAFCAGGDIVNLGNMARENQMHHRVKTFPKPIVSLGDGIVMGGGMGLCCNSRYRVGTARSMFAMPETKIGFYPDAGATHFLSRLGDVGMYLALTGNRTRGADALHLGFVTHFTDRIPELREGILACGSEGELVECLESFQPADDIPELTFQSNLLEISKCFSAPSVLEIRSRLQASGTEFAAATDKTLSTMSPIALCIAHRTQHLSRSLDFTECLRMEVQIADPTFALGEFEEGVRALLVDKDNNPRWNPATLEEITEEMINGVFSAPADWQPI